jgi:DNA-binding MarR family transcriptional regulator
MDALIEPTRLRLVAHLARIGGADIPDLAETLGVRVPALWHHVFKLESQGMVTATPYLLGRWRRTRIDLTEAGRKGLREIAELAG